MPLQLLNLYLEQLKKLGLNPTPFLLSKPIPNTRVKYFAGFLAGIQLSSIVNAATNH